MTTLPKTWRCGRLARGFVPIGLLMLAGSAAFGILIPASGSGNGTLPRLGWVGLMALFALALWRGCMHSRVIATEAGLTIKNPVLTREVPWSQIRDVRPGYSGLVVLRTDGGEVTAWAVQQANISTWLKRPTRAKQVAAEILAIAKEQASEGQ